MWERFLCLNFIEGPTPSITSRFDVLQLFMKYLLFFRRETGAKVPPEPVKRIEVLSFDNKQSSDRAVSLPCTSSDRWYQRWFLFRILRRNPVNSKCAVSRNSQENQQPSRSHTTSMDRSSSTTEETKTSSDRDADPFEEETYPVDAFAPLAYIRFDSQNEDSAYPLSQPTPPLTKSARFQRHGLDRNDSILSYLQQVDEAHESLVSRYPSDAVAIEQSISVITMDPALMYRHSIVLHDYSMSLRSIGSTFSMYEDEDGQEIDGKVAKLPLTEL